MISSLSGRVAELTSDAVEIEVGGVGYLVRAPSPALAKMRPGERVRMLTHMVVREDGIFLYGFPTASERDLFLRLVSVTGVGPKLALSVIGHLKPELFRGAVASGNVALLTAIPGVGTRSAQRMIVELKEQLGDLEAAGSPFGAELAEVREVLLGLGYGPSEVAPVLEEVATGVGDVEAMVRSALRALSRA
ncbi:MAG: Holliday junction branch migration protein RuvA [Actinomycetota bacterium]|nr:Holliday junction branch migration protein RuvA [Actinomycetota bacterium]